MHQPLRRSVEVIESQVEIIVEAVRRDSHFLERILSLVHLVGGGHILGFHHHGDGDVTYEDGTLDSVLLVQVVEGGSDFVRVLPGGGAQINAKAIVFNSLCVL